MDKFNDWFKELFEPPKYNSILQGGRRPNKSFDKILDLIDFSKKYPNENTLFIGKTIIPSIDNTMKYLKLKWYIYIEMDYKDLTRESFIGRFKIFKESE